MDDYLNRNLESDINSNYVENDIVEFFIEEDNHLITYLAKNPAEMSDTYKKIIDFLPNHSISEYRPGDSIPEGIERVVIESFDDFKRIYCREEPDLSY